jgi:hypothetical protein
MRHTLKTIFEHRSDAQHVLDEARASGYDIEDHEDEPVYGSVGTGGMRPVYPPGTQPGALQDRAHEDSRYFRTQRADSRADAGESCHQRMQFGRHRCYLHD